MKGEGAWRGLCRWSLVRSGEKARRNGDRGEKDWIRTDNGKGEIQGFFASLRMT